MGGRVSPPKDRFRAGRAADSPPKIKQACHPLDHLATGQTGKKVKDQRTFAGLQGSIYIKERKNWQTNWRHILTVAHARDRSAKKDAAPHIRRGEPLKPASKRCTRTLSGGKT